MKLNKFFMLGLAGLAFAACSNEDELDTTNLQSELGSVTVKLKSPTVTRTAAATGTDEVTVTGNITVTLVADEPAAEADRTVTVSAKDIADGKVTSIKFWNVKNPTKVIASMNEGKKDHTNITISEFKDVLPASIPAYGEANVTLTSNSESPALLEDDNVMDKNAKDEDKDIKFQMYTAEVKMEIPVARLEVSGIVHVTHEGKPDDVCEYSKLTIAGVYLDNVKETGGGELKDYQYPGATHGTGESAIFSDAATETNFLTGEKWPEVDGQAYAYNFYAPLPSTYKSITGITGAANPIFKIYFSEAVGSSEPKSTPRYAMIEDYGVTMEAGKIYRITKATIYDKNVLGDEGGETRYGVTVTIEEAKWSVVDMEATWKE